MKLTSGRCLLRPISPKVTPEEGWFEYLALVPDDRPASFRDRVRSHRWTLCSRMTPVGFTEGNIGAFAQAS